MATNLYVEVHSKNDFEDKRVPMTVLNFLSRGSKVGAANKNQLVNSPNRKQPHKIDGLKPSLSVAPSSAWYHDAAIREQLGSFPGMKR